MVETMRVLLKTEFGIKTFTKLTYKFENVRLRCDYDLTDKI